jgi:hypothetical protein
MPSQLLPTRPAEWLFAALFVAAYVVLDWASFMDPLFALNITPWNPDPAIGLVLWLRFGRRMALPLFIALAVAETVVRHMPAGPGLTLLLSAQLALGYGLRVKYCTACSPRPRWSTAASACFTGLPSSSPASG